MLNEEKVKLMTKASLFAEKEKNTSLYSNTFFKGDYVSHGMLKSVLGVTAGYLLIVVMWALYHIEALLTETSYEDLVGLGVNLLVYYGVVVVIYLIISFIFYRYRYKKYQKQIKEYQGILKKINKMNGKERKIKDGRKELS